jgi:hypothetical protein
VDLLSAPVQVRSIILIARAPLRQCKVNHKVTLRGMFSANNLKVSSLVLKTASHILKTASHTQTPAHPGIITHKIGIAQPCTGSLRSPCCKKVNKCEVLARNEQESQRNNNKLVLLRSNIVHFHGKLAPQKTRKTLTRQLAWQLCANSVRGLMNILYIMGWQFNHFVIQLSTTHTLRVMLK